MSQNFSRVKLICSINIIRSKIKIFKDGPTKYHFFTHATKNEPTEDHDFYKPNTIQKEINQQKITILMNQLRYKKQSISKRYQRKKKSKNHGINMDHNRHERQSSSDWLSICAGRRCVSQSTSYVRHAPETTRYSSGSGRGTRSKEHRPIRFLRERMRAEKCR